jgi:putative two-component system response regulator
VNILIAEDDKLTRTRLARFLERWGHAVTAAADGAAALESFRTQAVDLVITDWMMPEMDGPDLVRHIRGGRKPFAYIILLTSRSDKRDIISGLFDIGADDYVVKPFDPDELRARLSVGERTVALERRLREYSQGLEAVVRKQTRLIRETQEETIVKLLTALESRDHETGGHVRRIALYSERLAQSAGWTASRVDDLRLAAPMHDIGKIGVPDQILLKPARLTPDEFEIIKSHTTIGGRIFANAAYPMLQMARDIALFHHERWVGDGYPTGLRNGRIPEAARIVSLVDVFDALSTDRVYRKALPESEVLRLMREGRDAHFDPHLFDQFMEQWSEMRTILKENP